MSYITKNNARQIQFQVKRSEIEKIALDDLYKLSLWMLTKKEQQWLAAARTFYENPEFYVSHIYQKIEKKDELSLVYFGGAPAYHARKDCEALKQDYINYEIPVEIVSRGESAVHTFREWWVSEKQTLEADPSRFLELMSIRWLLKNPPSLHSISANNSGVKSFENPDIAVVESDIDNLIGSLNEINRANRDLIKDFGRRSFYIKRGSIEIDSPSDRAVLDDWDSKKSLLKDKLRLFFQLRFNPDLELDGSLLESIGFKRCKRCHEAELIISL
jgi:hypothetical protein